MRHVLSFLILRRASSHHAVHPRINEPITRKDLLGSLALVGTNFRMCSKWKEVNCFIMIAGFDEFGGLRYRGLSYIPTLGTKGIGIIIMKTPCVRDPMS
ncbi:uncharacterized protein F4812DRAFT_421303 [Daldinia caldariorum]|uniref:uncharacterized protein n=1 Tax=Daldinia caldariorum TaxID=326644 RepID=UPI00200874B4|nr:uncharacterized protein F4812DRAFT_421303 [Daldinia caldariorum]KAI1470044.1 hypothetical protein F4812DRAFT_421303 [Daldinia caldariorum]